MAAGDVEVRIVDPTITAIDTALTAMRATAGANGKFLMAYDSRAGKVILVAITEA